MCAEGCYCETQSTLLKSFSNASHVKNAVFPNLISYFLNQIGILLCEKISENDHLSAIKTIR